MINVQDTPVAQLEGRALIDGIAAAGRIGADDLGEPARVFQRSRRR